MGGSTPTRCTPRWPTSWPATKASAPCSRPPRARLQQVVLPVEQVDIGWETIDAGGWSANRLDDGVSAAARYTFDLTTQIPFHATLFRVADDNHVLVAVVHHIAADGSSITPLVRDLGLAYASRCVGQAPGWAPLPVQYVDYTLWQRAQFGELDDRDGPIAAQLDYWAAGPGRLARTAADSDRSALPAGG